MKTLLSTVLLFSFIMMSLACVKIDMKIPLSSGESNTQPTAPPRGGLFGEEEREGDNKDTENDEDNITSRRVPPGQNPCATDRKPTRATAQKTGVWCWAASAEGVMSFHEINLYQCQSVNQIKAGNLKDP